jgi:hypothetical protein
MFERLHDRSFSPETDGLKLADFILSLGNGTPIKKPIQQPLPSTPKRAAPEQTPSTPRSFSLTAVLPEGDVIAEALGDLYIFDINQRQFIPQHSNVRFQLVRSDSDPFVRISCLFNPQVFFFGITDDAAPNTPRLSQLVSPAINPTFRGENSSFIWVWIDDTTNTPMFSFSVAFNEETDFSEFRNVFGQCMYETQYKESFDKVKTDDRDFLIDAYMEDIEMGDYVSDEEEEVESEEEDVRPSASRDDDGTWKIS